MANVKTNFTTFECTREVAGVIGTIPGSPVWRLLEPNTVSTFGSKIDTVARRPITKNRQAQQGTIVDLDSKVDFEHDLTMDIVREFFPAFVMATEAGPFRYGPFETNTVVSTTTSTDVTTTPATAFALPINTLILMRGFTNAANNGLKVLTAGSTTTVLKTTGLVTETPPTNAEVAVCGVQGAAGDLSLDVSGNLNSAASIFVANMGLTVGQWIWVGGETAGTQFIDNTKRGWARITAITTAKLTLDKRSFAIGSDAGTAKTVQIFFGKFIRNVAVDSASFLERSYHFEAAWKDLISAGNDGYEYAKGNYCDQLSFNLPLTSKSTVTLGFLGTDTDLPVAAGSRKTNASTPIAPVDKTAFNTSSDILRLRITKIDETALTTYFKSATLKINNNVNPEKVIGTLGAAFMNVGNLEVSLEAQVLFTNKDVVTSIRNNDRVTLEFSVRNGNGAIMTEIPSVSLGDGSKELTVDQTVKVNLKGTAFEDPVLGTSISFSTFPYAPAS